MTTMTRTAALAVLLIFTAALSFGATITFSSQGTATDPGEYGRYGTDTTNHPLFLTSAPGGPPAPNGSQWVALSDPATDVSMFDTIGVPAGFVADAAGGFVTVYARTAANIFWDGTLLAPTLVYSEYSAWTAPLTAAQLTPGLHLLRVDVNARDLMPKSSWYGEFMGVQGPVTSPVPEPATLIVGVPFAAFAFLRWRRMKSA